MPEIFQRFDLDLEAMAEVGAAELQKLNLPQAGKTLVQELLQKGYTVLESNGVYNGVPEGVIVGGEIGKNHKGDFYELAERLGLQYLSGAYYTQRESDDIQS